MKESLDHALVVIGLLERDIAQICASGTAEQQGLAADCAEHRQQIANKLIHIRHLSKPTVVNQDGKDVTSNYFAVKDKLDSIEVYPKKPHVGVKIIPATPEESARLHELWEDSFREMDAQYDDDLRRDIIGNTNSHESRDRYEQNAKAGDFEPGDITGTDDASYIRKQARQHTVNRWDEYDRNNRSSGWILKSVVIVIVLVIVLVCFKILTGLF
jgi:hypothetical protein